MDPEESRDGDASDSLRDGLRSLGYLENPLSRFFAGGLVGRHPALRTHARVGLGVGCALGIASTLLTLPVLLASPGLATPWFSTIVLLFAFASALLLGLFAAGTMFLVYRATRRVVDRAELVARSTAVATFLLAFLYLLSYWKRYGAVVTDRFGWDDSTAAAIAAVAIVTIALALARLFHLAAYAVLASVPGYAFKRRPSGARRALAAGVVLAAIAAFAGARMRPADAAPEFAEQGDAITVERPLAPRVVFLAIDGLDLENARAVVASGWMPTLASWMKTGFVAPVRAKAADIPPAYWTTVATGLETHRHRIDAYYQSRVLGLSQAFSSDLAPPGVFDTLVSLSRVVGLTEEVPVTAATTRVMRVGDVAAAAGLKVASVNYWATYPAPAFAGTTISERAYLVLRAEASHDSPVDPSIAPDSVVPSLRRFLFDEAVASERVPRIREVGLEGNFATIHPLLYDLFVEAAALDVLEREAPQYLQIGLTGLDVLRYAYFTREPASNDVRRLAQVEVLRGVYGALDRFLADLRMAAGDDALIVLATCPGISADSPAAEGLLVAHGNAAASLDHSESLEPESLAPTLLMALGLPASAEQDGRAVLRMFRFEALADPSRAARIVRAFGLKPPIEVVDESSAEALRFLAQFGYFSSR